MSGIFFDYLLLDSKRNPGALKMKRSMMFLCALCAGLWLLFWLTACNNGNSTPTYSIGGTTNGLSGTLVLQNNGEDDLSLDADGTFTFATPLEDGSDYEVTIPSAPPMQNCTILNDTGTLAGADITAVAVSCVDKSWSHPTDLSDNLSPDGQDAGAPQVAMDSSGNAAIVWHQIDVGGINSQIFMSEFR
jgi:hypothetical protein